MEAPNCEVDINFRKIISLKHYHGNDIEQKALELYQCLSQVSKTDQKYVYIYLKLIYPIHTSKNYKQERISAKLPKNFRIILLSSLRHLKVYDKHLYSSFETLLRIIVTDVFSTLDYLDFRTLYLFKVLDQIVIKKLDLVSDIHESLLGELYEICYVSPIAILRNSAVSLIHKIELKMGNSLKTFNPLVNMGILTNYDDTKIKLEQIKTDSINSNLQEYMKFIHKYFHFNVYNKVAGILYKAVISRYSMDDFICQIWPFWCGSFEKQRNSREFQQSFLKYWIPFSVQEYQIELYTFLQEQGVPKDLLIEILFELRRKRHVSVEMLSEGVFFEDFKLFLNNNVTKDKAFEILCTFPIMNENITPNWLEIFEQNYLGCRINNVNSEKYVGQFLGHIFVSGHVKMQKNEGNIIYDNFLRKLNNFIIDSLNDEKNYDISLKLCKIFAGLKRSCKELKLKYDIPKKYQYGPEKNDYLLYLQDEGILDIFTEQRELITRKLIKIFNENTLYNDTAIWLLKNTFDTFQIEDLTATEIEKDDNNISLSNLEKYTECQKLRLHKTAKERDKDQLVLSFGMIEHQIVLAMLNLVVSERSNAELFNILKILNVLVVANQMKIVGECQSSTVIDMLNFMVDVVENDKHDGLSTRTRKILEHLFCKIIELLHLSPTSLKDHADIILKKLLVLIERSNMRKVVTDTLNLVTPISQKMANSDRKSQKSLNKFFRDLLNVIVSPANLDHLQKSRMRKHPRLRSLLHAICKGADNMQREFVVEAVRKIIWKTSQYNLEPTVHTVLLECLEIMIVEPNFHNYTSAYLEESINLSLNSFRCDNWSVKNAAIQLTNTIITRIFGVQQTDNIRLRSFQEFCILFPKLSDEFYNILSSPSLDDRAIIVLQYLSASEVLVYEHQSKEVQKTIMKFLTLLKRLLRSEENYIAKFIPHAFVNLCVEQQYPYYIRKLYDYVVSHLTKKPTNVIVNHLILFKEFVRKLNEKYSFLKPMDIKLDSEIIHVVEKMNNFLMNKNLQYLDLHNIRHFVLDQCPENSNSAISLNTSLKRCNLYNIIVNFPSSFITKNFQTLFDFIYDEEKFNFLMEIFLDQIISYALENRDLNLITKLFNTLTIKILKSDRGKKLNRILTESILKLNGQVVTLNTDLIVGLKDVNINFYQAILIHIIYSKNNCENKVTLCNEAFEKITQFRNLGNFELELVPKVLVYVYSNLDVLNKYSFLKFIFYLLLTDCDKEDVCEFLTKISKKYVSEDNYISNILTYEFLNDFFKNDLVVRRFLIDYLILIEKFENKTKFATFYMDTYQSLQIQKDVVNKILSKL